jgi:two-component system, sensor histidine kinase
MLRRDGPETKRELDDAHFRAIAEFTYDWETWVGAEGDVRWVNAAVERITGYSVAECLRLPDYPLDLVYEPDRERVRRVLERASAGESGNHLEFRVRRKDGAVLWAAISFQPLRSSRGANLGYRSSVRDIHERKQLEARLSEALVQAESANRSKSEFLASVSHELRTPLQSILGYAELLDCARLEPTLSGYVTTLLEQGKLLDRLVSDLLDYSSLQAGLLSLRSEPYHPRALLEAMVRALSPLAREKGLELVLGAVHAPEVCVGDPARLSQVLGNLVTNAIKFTERGGIAIAVDHDGSDVRVTVDDSGPGMPDDDSLFAPFKQAAPGRGGVGLGLAISRQLCERMGGALVAGRSPTHGGARFVASFPARVSGDTRERVEHFVPNGKSTRLDPAFASRYPLGVLVVDDMPAARDFMQAALRAAGYDAAIAASAEEGLRLAQARAPDLVLLDIHMPEIDGWSAAKRLRGILGPGPLLVALTANALANDDEQLRAAGFDGFAQKPLHVPELLTLLQRTHERLGARPLGSELDAARWRELAELDLGGESLLDRMLARVLEALPEALARAEAARMTGEYPELARALHDLHGLCSLIGATRAAERLARCEQAAERRDLPEVEWNALERHLEVLSSELTRRSLARRHIHHVVAAASQADRAPDQGDPHPEP